MKTVNVTQTAEGENIDQLIDRSISELYAVSNNDMIGYTSSVLVGFLLLDLNILVLALLSIMLSLPSSIEKRRIVNAEEYISIRQALVNAFYRERFLKIGFSITFAVIFKYAAVLLTSS